MTSSTAVEKKARVTGDKSGPVRRTRKPARCTEQDQATAQVANRKAQPAAKVTGPNIALVRKGLQGRTPSEYMGVSKTTLSKMANGNRSLDADQKQLVRDLGLPRDTFYGRKVCGMLYALEVEQAK